VFDYTIGDFEVLVDDVNLRARVHSVVTGETLKRFSGETAWVDARRFANDRYWESRYAE
jgi:hypothetical protein